MGQLDFCPQPYPDETLFSLVSRYHRLTGFRDYRDTLELLFGTPVALPHCTFPRHLQAISSVLFSEKGISFVIDNLTIFPYFRPFLPAWQAEKAMSYLVGQQTGAIKTLLGMVASQVGAKTLFRFCPACLDVDRLQYGQAYWHRAHQLPGVWLCPSHHLPLFEVDGVWMEGQRRRLVLPDEFELHCHAAPLHVVPAQRDLLDHLAQLSTQLLHANLTVISPLVWQQLYLQRAVELDLARPSGRLYLTALDTYLRQTMMQLPSQREFSICTTPSGELPGWLLMLLRKPRHAVHPFKHLLLAIGLGLNTEALLQWVVAPRMALAAEPSSLKTLEVSRVSDGVLCQTLARPAGSLRQAALLTGISVTTLRLDAIRLGLSVQPRPKTLTPSVISALEQDFLAGLSLSVIAAKKQLSLASLYRVLRMKPLMAKQWRNLQAERDLRERRHRFLADVCTMSLRQSPEYHWLYRHDRTWLLQQVVEYGKIPHRSEKRVDWDQRDRLLADRVVIYSKETLQQKGRPNRITMFSIGRALHVAALLEQHLSQLPLTAQAIAAVVETPQEFHYRRLDWARDQLLAKGEPVIRWRLLRQAGIRSPSSDEVQKYIMDLCQDNVL